MEWHFHRLPGLQPQKVDTAFQRHNPAIEQLLWAHLLAAKVVDEEQAKIDKVLQKVVGKFKGADDLTDREAKVVGRNLDAIANGTHRYMMGEIKVARIMNKSALDGLRALAVYSAQSLKVYGKVGKEVEEAAKDDLGSGASED